MNTWRIDHGDALTRLRLMPAESVQCCVCSPPYWGQRDYGVTGQLGLNQTPDAYVCDLVGILREVRRVLALDGVLWINIGDSHQNAKGQAGGIDPKQSARRHGLRPQDVSIPGLKPKDLVGVPWMVAFALRADGWWLRQDVIWYKPNGHPEAIKDRPSNSHEHVFLLTKARRYFYNAKAIGAPASPQMLRQVEEGYAGAARRDYAGGGALDPSATKLRVIQNARKRLARDGFLWVNARSVWTIQTGGADVDHFAVMPETLATRCVLAGSRVGDTILDPFCGSGTTGLAALGNGRNFHGIELNATYVSLARSRLAAVSPLFSAEASA